jgi:hypothetical protein
VLKLGTISLDGTKIHADASRHNAVSYKRLLELETQLRAEIEELFRLSEQSDQPDIPDGLVVREEMARREDRLVRLAEAKAVLQARASERLAAEQAEYETKLARSGSARPGADLVAVRRPRRCQDPATATSTILPTRSRAS